MANSSYRGLNAGRVGDGNYNHIESRWAYSVANSNIIAPQVAQRLNIADTNPEIDVSSTHRQFGSSFVLRATTRLLGGYPEFVGGSSAISQSLKTPTSLHFLHLQNGEPPYTGKLLASAQYLGSRNQRRTHTARVRIFVAYPGGTNGEILYLVPSLPQMHICDIDIARPAQIDSFSYENMKSWVGQGESIRQICFSGRQGELTPILGVRHASSIEVFHPKLQSKTTNDRASWSKERSKLGELDLNHVISIPAAVAGDALFVDMMFNPRKPRYLASVSAFGLWHIWYLDVKKRTFKLLHRNHVSLARYHIRTGGPSDQSDGWHKVIWVGNDWIVAVCTRIGLEVSNIRTGSQVFHMFDWAKEEGCRTLDVMLRPSCIDELLCITSNKIYWLRITHIDVPGVSDISSSKLETVFFWVHHRDKQDITLQLSYRSHEEGFSIFLFSRNTPEIEEYRIKHGYRNQTRYPPGELSSILVHPLPRIFQPSIEEGLSDVQFWQYALDSDAMNGPGTLIQCISLVQGFWLRETLFTETPIIKPVRLSGNASHHRSSRVPRIRKMVKSQRLAVEDFVVGDDIYESETDDDNLRERFEGAIVDEVWDRANAEIHIKSDTVYKLHGVNMCDIYSRVSQSPVADERAFDHNLRMLARALSGDRSDQLTQLVPILACWPWKRAIGEEFEMSDALQALKDSHISTPSLRFCYASQVFNKLPVGDNVSLSSLYQSLRDDWFTSLPHTWPIRIRMEREKHLRQIAIELYLSSWCVASTEQAEPGPEVAAAVEGSAKTWHDVRDAAVLRSSPQIGQDLVRTTRSRLSGGRSSQDSTPTPAAQSALTRLQQYVKIGKVDYSPSIDTNRVMSHWKMGTNPAKYDYQAAVTSLAQANRRIREATSSSIQSRLKRRAERQLSKPSNLGKGITMDPRITASQPAAGEALFSSSQDPTQTQFDTPRTSMQTSQPDVAASQVQSGRYGGRQPRGSEAMKQSKRKRGF